jgi:hypothetical protein
MTVTFYSLTNLARAIEEVADLDLHMFDDLGPKLTCIECDSMTGLLDALGLGVQARRLYDAHCVDEAEDNEMNGTENIHVLTGKELVILYDQQYAAAQLKRTLELEMIEQRR